MAGQVALDFAQEELHGHLIVWFSRGMIPIQCTLMAPDLSWHNATGDTLVEAVGAAIDKCGSDALRQSWAKTLGGSED